MPDVGLTQKWATSMDQPPNIGRVLGVDVGFAVKARTTCFCSLEWTQSIAALKFALATSNPDKRRQALRELSLTGPVSGVALDGPLTRTLRLVSHYRAAEAILSRGVLQKRGKPGQTSSPTGQQLHQHATALARLALESVTVECATHHDAIHCRCLVEAFPNMYLAALVNEREIPQLMRDATDRYWETLVDRSDSLSALVGHLLPGRRLTTELRAIRNHEHRAGVICALTALSVVVNDYVSVGDPEDGHIVLPPFSAWGREADGSARWLERVLRLNVAAIRSGRGHHQNHRQAQIVTGACCWI